MLIDNSAKTNWKFIGVVAILAILIGGGILVLASQKEVPSPIVETAKPNVVTGDEAADWQTYRNEELGLQFQYPSEYDNNPRFCGPRLLSNGMSIYAGWRITLKIEETAGLDLRSRE